MSDRSSRRTPLLVAGQPGRHTSWLELFFDLAFVVAVGAVSGRLGSGPDVHPADLAVTLGLFVVVWWAWLGQAFFDNRFEQGDTFHQFAVLAATAGAGAMTLGIADAPRTWLLPAAYVLVRGCLLALYLRARHLDASARAVSDVYLPGFGVGFLCWAGSVAAPPGVRPWLWAAVLAVDLLTPWLGRRRLTRVPVDPAHLPDRLGGFTIILLGSILVDVLDALPAHPGPPALAVALTAFLIPAAIWWIYRLFAAADLSANRLRGGQPYAYLHGVLTAALLLIGWCLGVLVRQAAADAQAAPAHFRLLVGVSLGLWMVTGAALQHVGPGGVGRRRAAVTGIGVLGVLAAAWAPHPAAMLVAIAAVMLGYAALIQRFLLRAERAPAARTG
ncbi:low temperature requirement protein A [Micromonospora sp. NPDC051006]|uniref:low temperature requirement protein A n=1 Tax=Micromonospora sp. NPDC051006 TaxID=3364283 RepID=UPI00378A3209